MSSAPQAVLITGASTGIGAACAIDLAGRGFRVFAGVRKAGAGAALVERGGANITPVTLDVTDASQIAAVRQQLEASLPGGLWGLVNNAGVVVVGPLELVPIAEFRRQLEINLTGQVAVTQALLPLVRNASGRVVFMGSFNGLMAPPFFGPYAASKFALEAVADCLRVELRHWRIGVSIVEPGSIATPIWDKSKAAADVVFDAVGADACKLYADDIEAMRKAAVMLAERAMPVDRVVRVVRHALTARRPWPRYPVGAEAWGARTVAKVLPDRVRDFILRCGLGMKRRCEPR